MIDLMRGFGRPGFYVCVRVGSRMVNLGPWWVWLARLVRVMRMEEE
jgi:hypothetical protein